MIGLEQMTPAGQENTEPVVMPDEVRHEADVSLTVLLEGEAGVQLE